MVTVKRDPDLEVLVDRISLLPNDVLGCILSQLTLKEATATSILSRRWRHSWTLMPKLDLDWKVLLHRRKRSKGQNPEELVVQKVKRSKLEEERCEYARLVRSVLLSPDQVKGSKLEEERCDYVKWVDSVLLSPDQVKRSELEEERRDYARWVGSVLLSPDQVKRLKDEEERCDYVKWVDSVVSLHQSSHLSANLEEFRVTSDLNMNHRRHIDRWLSYALSRGVQRLELNFNVRIIGMFPDFDRRYTFPSKTWNFPDNFKLLRSLSMHLVNVSGESLEYILANCPHLERLCVIECRVFSSLKIIRPFPSFNYLEISLCRELKSVVVRDSNLVNINYNGKRIRFQLVNVPLLTQLWIGGSLTERLDDAAKMFSSVLPQLETFKISFSYKTFYRKGTRRFASAVEMSSLKQLVVSLCTSHAQRDTILPVIYLINASPRLQRFVLEAPHGDSECQAHVDDGWLHAKRVSKMMPRAYSHHLKEIEFVGYHGEFNLLELMKHFVEKDIALENIIVDPRCYTYRVYRPWVRVPLGKIKEKIAARASAKKQLRSFVPSRINVKIL